MVLWPSGEAGDCKSPHPSSNLGGTSNSKKGEYMTYLQKDGLFWRIALADGEYLSEKKFWTASGAWKYYDNHQDRHGVPVVKNTTIQEIEGKIK